MNVVPMTPLTNVRILKEVPLDSSYTDTMDFSSISAQTTYFQGKTKYTYSNLGPVRLQNSIRIPNTADNLYDCNYIMFQNANFNTKWFYAFITEIKFINVNMCEVNFEIDIMQTWMFDVTLKACYVEREHSATDNVGDNMVLENVDLGEYVNETGEKTPFFDSYMAVIATAYDPSGEAGGYFGGTFSGLSYVAGLIDDDAGVKNVLDFLDSAVKANKADSITSTFVMPSIFYTTGTAPVMQRYEVNKKQTSLGSYTPINKKLLTYPYNFLLVTTSDGASAKYRYEYFQGDTSAFVVECAMGCNPEIVLEPIAYNNQQFNIDESLALSGFPQFGFSIDTFRAWLAQNGNSQFISAATSALAVVGGTVTGNPMAVAGGFLGIASNINNFVMASYKADQSRGAQGSNTLVGTREKNFYFYQRHIREDYAKIIDDYFTVYGYATEEVKVPNIKTRTSWNYVKTRNSKITGSVPFEDIERMKKVYDNGVTFWHGEYIGDYSRNNSPIGG